jgi:hypothetical protein
VRTQCLVVDVTGALLRGNEEGLVERRAEMEERNKTLWRVDPLLRNDRRVGDYTCVWVSKIRAIVLKFQLHLETVSLNKIRFNINI